MKKFSYILAAALCCCMALAIMLAAKKQKEVPVRLLYWNIQNGMWADQGNNWDNFVAWVSEQDPDICVWAESKSHYRTGEDVSYVLADRETQYLPDNWDVIAERYGHKYVYVGGERDFFPQTITSKYPIKNVKRIVGERPDSVVTHGAGWAQIKIAGKTLNVVTLHTWPQKYGFEVEDQKASSEAHEGDYYRAKELKYICEHTIGSAPGSENEYWMMMGDFNSKTRLDNWHYQYPDDTLAFLTHDYVLQNTPYIDVLHQLRPDEFQDTHFNGTRIDYVYCTKPLYDCVQNAYVPRDGWVDVQRIPTSKKRFCQPSDHRPIIVDFKL